MINPKWRAIGLLLTVFALGTAAGGGAMAAWNGRQRLRAAREMWGPHPNRPMLMLVHRLGLSPAQEAAIDKTLAMHEPKRRAIMQMMTEKCGQDLVLEKSALDSEIRSLLNGEQQTRFDELSSRQRERFFGHRRPPPSHD